MGNKSYLKYVFDEKNRKFIGDFDKMYAVEKIENFGKSFDQLTKDTVKGFLTDSKMSKFNLK